MLGVIVKIEKRSNIPYIGVYLIAISNSRHYIYYGVSITNILILTYLTSLPVKYVIYKVEIRIIYNKYIIALIIR